MAPIPVYTDSPISAAKPSGVTPKTAVPAGHPSPVPNYTAATATASPTSPTPASYPAAQPGAAPSLPTSTPLYTAIAGLAPPQPGPTPASVPPPPKAGEKYQHPQPTPAPQLATMPYPQQISIPSPATSYPSQQHGTSTATAPSSLYGKQPSTSLGGGQDTQHFQHPPSYQQDTNASELDRYQRSAIQQNELEAHTAGDSEGIWGTARKLAQQTGEKLAAAENEVWKKINKE
ncbi:hypothetical protein F5X99DRAFT_237635 [Biscogniauxia marginata]|nr:hypothetical protein F5X99DRAFT_237635 [Biscogniauxia marginata]